MDFSLHIIYGQCVRLSLLLASGILENSWYIDYGQRVMINLFFSGQSLPNINCLVLLNLSAQSLPAGGGEGLSSSCPVLQQQD